LQRAASALRRLGRRTPGARLDFDGAAGDGTGGEAVPMQTDACTDAQWAVRELGFVLVLRDNANSQNKPKHGRFFLEHVISDLAVGGLVWLHAAIDTRVFSSEKPCFIKLDVWPRDKAVATASALSQRYGTHDLATLRTRASADGFFFYQCTSELPSCAWHLQPGSLSLSPLAANASVPLSRQRFTLKCQLMASRERTFQERCLGLPYVLVLGSASDVLAVRGGFQLAVSDEGLPPPFIDAVHLVRTGALDAEAKHAPWEPAGPHKALAAELGPDLWQPSDLAQPERHLGRMAGEQPTLLGTEDALRNALAAAKAAAAATTDASTSATTDASTSATTDARAIVVLTHERQPKLHKLHGGAGTESAKRASKKLQSSLRVQPLAGTYAELPNLAEPCDDRIAVILKDFKQAFHRALYEPLRAVHANPNTNLGMWEVIAHDAALLNYPMHDVLDNIEHGHDRGRLLYEGDQLTIARFHSLRRIFARAITDLRDLLDGLHGAARRSTLPLLREAVAAYELLSCITTKNGPFHLELHSFRRLEETTLPLGKGTICTLLSIPRIDAKVTDFWCVLDFERRIREPSLHYSLVRKMRETGHYPSAHTLLPLTRERRIELVQERIFARLETFTKSWDKITRAHAVELRLVHEALEQHDVTERNDKEFMDECFCPLMTALFRESGKYNVSMQCARQTVEVCEQSAWFRRGARSLFSHALTDPEQRLLDALEAEAYETIKQADVHNQASDWLNEHLVDSFKRAIDGFSTMLGSQSDRLSRAHVFLQRARQIVLALCGGGAGFDCSRHVASGAFDEIIASIEILGAGGADVWAHDPARTELFNAVAAVHYLQVTRLNAEQLNSAVFRLSDAPPGLPEFVGATTHGDASAASSSADNVRRDIAMAEAQTVGLGSLPAAGHAIVAIGDVKLQPLAISKTARKAWRASWPVVVQAFLLDPALAQPGTKMRLRTHAPSVRTTEGSFLTPMLRQVASRAAASDVTADGRGALLARLLTHVSALEGELLEKMEGKVSRSTALKLHHEEARALSEAAVLQACDEVHLREVTNAYHTKTILPELLAIEQRDTAVAAVASDQAAGRLGDADAQPDSEQSDEDRIFVAKFEALQAALARAARAKAKATSLYMASQCTDNGDSATLALQELRRAVDLADHAHSLRLALQKSVGVGFVQAMSADDIDDEFTASGFQGDAREAMAKLNVSGRRQQLTNQQLVYAVRSSPRKLSSASVRRVEAAARGESAAANRPRRQPPSAPRWPAGSEASPYGCEEPTGKYARELVGRKVAFDQRLNRGAEGTWSTGHLKSYDWSARKFKIQVDQAANCAQKARYGGASFAMKLPSPFVRYFAAGGAVSGSGGACEATSASESVSQPTPASQPMSVATVAAASPKLPSLPSTSDTAALLAALEAAPNFDLRKAAVKQLTEAQQGLIWEGLTADASANVVLAEWFNEPVRPSDLARISPPPSGRFRVGDFYLNDVPLNIMAGFVNADVPRMFVFNTHLFPSLMRAYKYDNPHVQEQLERLLRGARKVDFFDGSIDRILTSVPRAHTVPALPSPALSAHCQLCTVCGTDPSIQARQTSIGTSCLQTSLRAPSSTSI
jgi:hypothetical protein